MTPTASQIRAQVAAVLEREPDAFAVGIHADREQDWPAELAVAGRRFVLRWCDSPLAVRLALYGSRSSNGAIILTSLADQALGADVLSRLSRGKLFKVQQWEIVSQAFQARAVDGRLGRDGWLADLLIEHMPPGGYPPAPSGVLDAETAWRSLLQVTVSLETARPDIDTLLRWTADPNALHRFAALPEQARSGILDWLHSATGTAGHLILGAVAAGHGADVIPLGLVCAVLLADASPELAAAAVRLERFTSGRRLERVGGERWAEAAERVIRGAERAWAQPFLERAERLLEELYLSRFAVLSEILPSGFEARLAAYAEALNQFTSNCNSLAALERAASRVRAHYTSVMEPVRIERVEMATRLARWLLVETPREVGFEGHLLGYAADGAFVDWARLKLLGGDQLAGLSRSYSVLAERVRVRREAINRAFAGALKVWDQTGSTTGVAIPVERILDEVVAPLAEAQPVLLLVVDGLSLPVFAELAADLSKLGWLALKRESGKWPGVAVSALPTITEVSRASLLSGRLTCGNRSAEKTAFAQHSALAARSRPSSPILFHKGDLGEGLGLSSRVREAVGSRESRIVGVVYNAIDDQLDGANQLHLRWSLEDLRMLPALLHEARGAGRVIVLTADHGHVVEHETTQRSGSDGDRWRRPDGALTEEEVQIDGGRVLTPAGATTMVAPWSERIRYGAKKNGYHGGVTPQEVVVPLCVLATSGMIVPGWQPMPLQSPDWWHAEVHRTPMIGTARIAPPAPALTRKPRAPQPDLFSPEPAAGDWIAALLASSTYLTQKTLAARVAPEDHEVRRLLEALAERGGKLPKTALGQRLSLPPLRLGGFLSAARRVLNVDRAAVLSVDEASGTVELNQSLLEVQFQIRTR